MKKMLLALALLVGMILTPTPAKAMSDTVSCNDYTGREKTACKNGKEFSNAHNAGYCSRYTSVTQIEACEMGQHIGQYIYKTYCSNFGTNYGSCVMPTASSAPAPEEDDSGVVAPRGVTSDDECLSTSFNFSENCTQAQKILKAMNFALPVVFIFGIAGVAFGIVMRTKTQQYTDQRKQSTMLIWVVVGVVLLYSVVVLILNATTPGGVLFDMI